MSYSTTIKEELVSLINKMDQYHWLFTRDANKDFSRTKKWSFGELMRFIISMEGKSLKDELLEHFISVWILQRIHHSIRDVLKYCQKPLNFSFGSLPPSRQKKSCSVDIAYWPVTDQICALHIIRRMKQHIFNPHQIQKASI